MFEKIEKHILSLMIVTFSLVSCNSSNRDYQFESNLLECFFKSNNRNDISNALNKVENVLIKNKILENNSGQSFVNVFTKLSNDINLETDNQQLIIDINSLKNIPTNLYCRDSNFISNQDSAIYKNSKYFELHKELENVKIKGDIVPKSLATAILKVLDSTDFENKYYKSIGLLMITRLIQIDEYDTGLSFKLDPTCNDFGINLQPEAQNILNLRIDNKDQIFANGEPIKLKKLKNVIVEFISKKSEQQEIELPLSGKQMSTKGVVSIKSDRETSFAVYIQVQNELKSTYDQIRNQYSKRIFHKGYHNLSLVQQDEIRRIIPQQILEKNPE